ncbi:MAG: glycosyl hydrolase family 98, partial [Bacteroidales bacterium]|nr:glycosyl hydrolase family 98 [Bacteroidales bacterium]
MYEKVVKGFIVLIVLLFVDHGMLYAQQDFSLRRPISPDQPMWLIHIDTWNYPDPQKIIDLIPKDIRPYVVMNISLSVFHDSETYRFARAEYGYEIAKSWLRTCAENRMWAMIQPASGGYSHFPDGDLSVFEEFFSEYPNFIGFNYAEQFWGFGEDNPYSPEWSERMSHFANLLELSNQYGGYLVVSICWNKWNPGVNPIGMLKRSKDFATACSKYTENYILFDKHTQVSYLHDRESMCLGAYLSGYSGQYGIRYDDTGWTDANGNHHENYTMATYGAPFLEHTMLTGLTSFDGPELIWTQCFKEVDAVSTTNGYNTRKWETFPQFDNVSVDLFRKVLDGTVRIPGREEVIDRTKYVLIHDVNSGSDDNKYSSPAMLYQGLYRMENDGNHGENWSFFKKTGRYPTIPVVYGLDDEMANSFEEIVYKSDYSNRWPSISSKVDEFNQDFPEEYTGDIYAGRHENGWVTYNPFKTGQTANGSIPFKYNTCERMELSYSRYTAGVIKEYPDRLDIYLNNYDNVLNGNLKTDVIRVYGSTSEPDYTVTDRGINHKSKVKKNWSNGVFTLTIDHNGPVDIKINCSGNATNRLTEYQTANIVVPHSPPAYKGIRQYEAETFDYKNIAGIEKNAADDNIRNYTGQGYLKFGTNSKASVRDYVTVLNDGTYNLKTKYTVTGGDVNFIDLYVNGDKVVTPSFTKTEST